MIIYEIISEKDREELDRAGRINDGLLDNVFEQLKKDKEHQNNFESRQKLGYVQVDNDDFSSYAQKYRHKRFSTEKDIFSPVVIPYDVSPSAMEDFLATNKIVIHLERPKSQEIKRPLDDHLKPYSFDLQRRLKEISIIDKFSECSSCESRERYPEEPKKDLSPVHVEKKSSFGGYSLQRKFTTREEKLQQQENLQRLKNNMLRKNLDEVLKSRKVKFYIDKQEQLRLYALQQEQELDQISKVKLGGKRKFGGFNKLKKASQNIIERKRKLKQIGVFQDIAKQKAGMITRKFWGNQNSEEYKYIFNAIEQDRPSVVKDFVNYNLQLINMQNHDGYTILCYATHFARKEIVDFLLMNGADPNIQTQGSLNTPLHIACHYKYKKIIEVLLDAGADENLLNKDGLQPWEGIVPQQQQ